MRLYFLYKTNPFFDWLGNQESDIVNLVLSYVAILREKTLRKYLESDIEKELKIKFVRYDECQETIFHIRLNMTDL